MLNKLLDFFCPLRRKIRDAADLLTITSKLIHEQKIKLQKLEDILSNKKTQQTTIYDKLSVTSHAIHRYRSRFNGKGTDEEISKMLYKLLIQQLATLDTLPDGKYTLKRGLVGIIKDASLVTVIPNKADKQTPKLK